ncbi:DUF5074 domain-containing protein [Rapidithrix thailandica]|uniref:DUF5074 domain-containing protein n=1 Tax=Rapidithrix thailandica TaxID=413964 RepID=A0AAW9S032_9BACT
MKILKCLFFSLLSLLVLACNEPEEAAPQADLGFASGKYQQGIFITNEGNFDWGHGTISHFNPETGEVSNNIFKQKNGFELGNVVQSMTLHKDKGYVVVNNSARIEIVNPATMEWQGRIHIPKSSPRYLLPLSNKKAYVTDLYADRFYVIDLQKDSLIKEIPTTGWTEKMTQLDKWVFMTQTRTVFDNRKEGGELLLKIDGATDQVVDSVALPKGPMDVVLDARNKLWVLCNGGLIERTPALVKINPYTLEIEKQFDFGNDAGTYPSRLRMNDNGTKLYYLNHHIYEQDIDADTLNQEPLVPANGRLFYGLGFDTQLQQVYACDAIDYVQQGWVFRFDLLGVKIDSFKVGVIPGEFVF